MDFFFLTILKETASVRRQKIESLLGLQCNSPHSLHVNRHPSIHPHQRHPFWQLDGICCDKGLSNIINKEIKNISWVLGKTSKQTNKQPRPNKWMNVTGASRSLSHGLAYELVKTHLDLWKEQTSSLLFNLNQLAIEWSLSSPCPKSCSHWEFTKMHLVST